ncbi:helix-turn-helix domain-containing protein [Cronobacter sakazakii]|uniref:helix-turn-helix domain-containing protein n=1 Tax=Cronobacter sakazakii TaxID=28141 RepID=UPI0009BB0EF5|nr:helix-turn-helix transcriptional regulator [Cronobacter sakazakii]EIZ9238932.1 helix-turn-helix domain-containing protein [Cronobacter sakazakii]ELY4184064.1 helix-turn-helix domain-containing protein [Cronobacter sakazakii]MDT3653155.1 helix-turn-helix transcriptional regulator [Cronobacter sakazakii]PUX72013.1 XRE family transcriptional regulator [Cronobacter sakazakii]
MNTRYPLKTLSQLRPLLMGFRKKQGLTQKEVSARLGVTQQTYARLEANPETASIERLFRVFNVLGIEMTLCETQAAETDAPARDDSPAHREVW